MQESRQVIKYGAQPGPQSDALSATWCDEILYGGARGGGKSFCLLLDFAQDVPKYREFWHGICFRRTYPELSQLIADSHLIYPLLGAEFAKGERMWKFPQGSTLKFRNLERGDDHIKYQGHAYPWIGFDELTQWQDDTAYKYLRGCNRPTGPVPCRIRATTNPQGVGHNWVKSMFIDSAPAGFKPTVDPDTDRQIMYIPARVYDNKILLKNNPNYIKTLRGTGSPDLVRAWLDGDWSVISGSFFPEFSLQKHVINPIPIPKYWDRVRAFDWGSSKPSCCLWAAISDGTIDGIGKGDVVIYREYYSAIKPNIGLRLPADAVADNIVARSQNETYRFSCADPSIFSRDGGESIAERMARRQLVFTSSPNSRLSGWNLLRTFLVADDDEPALKIFSNCVNLIRTLPAQQHSNLNAEDLDTHAEDHAVDTLRYLLLSRVSLSNARLSSTPELKSLADCTYEDLFPVDSY